MTKFIKNKKGLVFVSIGLIFMVYDNYEFYDYESKFCLIAGYYFILFGLIIIFGKYIWKKTMNFYGDFNKLKLVASDVEQLKVLLNGNNWWDRASINFDFDKHKPIIEKSSISIPFITSNSERGRINFYIKFEKENQLSPKRGLIKMTTEDWFMQTFGIFVCRSIRRTIKSNLFKP